VTTAVPTRPRWAPHVASAALALSVLAVARHGLGTEQLVALIWNTAWWLVVMRPASPRNV